MNTESFLQAPTPKQQIQSFADEVIAWEIILRSIETILAVCPDTHRQVQKQPRKIMPLEALCQTVLIYL